MFGVHADDHISRIAKTGDVVVHDGYVNSAEAAVYIVNVSPQTYSCP